MPNPLIAKLAQQFKVNRATVEAAWADCKQGIQPGEKGKGWGLVVECTRAKLRALKQKK